MEQPTPSQAFYCLHLIDQTIYITYINKRVWMDYINYNIDDFEYLNDNVYNTVLHMAEFNKNGKTVLQRLGEERNVDNIIKKVEQDGFTFNWDFQKYVIELHGDENFINCKTKTQYLDRLKHIMFFKQFGNNYHLN